MPVAPGKKCSPYNFRFIQDDPLKVCRILWPKMVLANFQEEMIYSAWFNKHTFVRAGNMLGKDFTAGVIALVGFLTREPCRIVTTSAKEEQLDILWGEIRQLIRDCKYPLSVEHGGPLFLNHQHIRIIDYKTKVGGQYAMHPKSSLKGLVASDETMGAMGGRHIGDVGDGVWKSMWMADEASHVASKYYDVVQGWTDRCFVFGNCFECDNFFKEAFKGIPGDDRKRGGDLKRGDGTYYRRCIQIKGEDSPNVRLGQAQVAAGKEPTNETLVPGLMSFPRYKEAREFWDVREQCIKLDAEWYTGRAVMLFPQEWLDRSLMIGREMRGVPRKAKAIGVDPAEGGDWTCVCVVDEYGIIELIREKTPNTADVQDLVVQMFHKYGVPQSKVYFDSGGGGKQHVDSLIRQGYKFHAVSFGEGVTHEPKRMKKFFDEIVDNKEDKGAYFNRRAEMYGEAAILFDPLKKLEDIKDEYDEQGNYYRKAQFNVRGVQAFGIPPDGPQYAELVRQLAIIPKKYIEGKLKLPPKSKQGEPGTGEKTLTELLGRSPDEADSFVLAVYAMTGKRTPFVLKGYS